MRRLVVWAALLLAVIALASACVPVAPVPGPAPGGLALRLDRPTYRVATFGSTGGATVATDSLEVSATWTPAAVTDQYGPVDSVRVVILGGYPSATKVRVVGPAVASAVANLPLDLSGTQAQSVSIDARVCVQTFRRNVAGPEVCQDTNPVVITFPAPPGVSGLTATAVRRVFP